MERPFAKQQALGYTSNGGPLQGRRKTYPTPSREVSENHRLQKYRAVRGYDSSQKSVFLGLAWGFGLESGARFEGSMLTSEVVLDFPEKTSVSN